MKSEQLTQIKAPLVLETTFALHRVSTVVLYTDHMIQEMRPFLNKMSFFVCTVFHNNASLLICFLIYKT